MTYSVNAVANEFLRIGRYNGDNINLMRLQKLMYYAHGWHLALTRTPLFNEFVEAWDYGPVIASLYYQLRHLGMSSIHRYVVTENHRMGTRYVEFIPATDTRTLFILNKVYAVYRQHSTVELANMTHVKNGPWATTLEAADGMIHKQMDNRHIAEYFTKMGMDCSTGVV